MKIFTEMYFFKESMLKALQHKLTKEEIGRQKLDLEKYPVVGVSG